ncbi:MAG TPA: site-2 protease family protein [Candidatus Binatia bacterium]|nr:site-2 protease family protein [Candidatus Binatia bacterium]
MSDPTPPVSSSTLDYMRPMPVYAPVRPRPRYWLHALLLLATCLTTLVTGARMQYNYDHNRPALSFSDEPVHGEIVPIFPVMWARTHPERLLGGLPFMATLMFFFLAHEMGHYLYCRRYGVYATLPFFIPVPVISPIGTMGAVIVIRSRIRSRTALFDIGIAGPIAGFIVAACVLFFSLLWSKPMHGSFGPAEYRLGYPLIFHLAYRALAALGLLRVSGLPLSRLLLHPTAIAAWVGMLATSLNLLPGGQLDGGHIIYSIAPRAHKIISRLTILVLLPMAFYLWLGWLIWAVLLQLSSLRHPQVAEWPRVTGARLWLAAFALLMLALTLTPAPSAHSSLLNVIHDWNR